MLDFVDLLASASPPQQEADTPRIFPVMMSGKAVVLCLHLVSLSYKGVSVEEAIYRLKRDPLQKWLAKMIENR